VRALSELGLRSLTSHPPTLEQLFLRHYGDELAAEGVPVQERPR
jgi:ABC-2 type transport system ATP-binding protein